MHRVNSGNSLRRDRARILCDLAVVNNRSPSPREPSVGSGQFRIPAYSVRLPALVAKYAPANTPVNIDATLSQ